MASTKPTSSSFSFPVFFSFTGLHLGGKSFVKLAFKCHRSRWKEVQVGVGTKTSTKFSLEFLGKPLMVF